MSNINNESGGGKKSKGTLEYILTPMDHSILFQVISQKPIVTQFLEEFNFISSHGWRVALADDPEHEGLGANCVEIQDSTNTIFLQGSNGNWPLKLDVTRFVSNKIRDGKINTINAALRELVAAVKKYYKPKYPEMGIGTKLEVNIY